MPRARPGSLWRPTMHMRRAPSFSPTPSCGLARPGRRSSWSPVASGRRSSLHCARCLTTCKTLRCWTPSTPRTWPCLRGQSSGSPSPSYTAGTSQSTPSASSSTPIPWWVVHAVFLIRDTLKCVLEVSLNFFCKFLKSLLSLIVSLKFLRILPCSSSK